MNIKDNKTSRSSVIKIKNSICKLLNNVGHRQLSIKAVCADAGINRTTFYAHFDNIESALYQICEEYIVKAYKIFLNVQIPYRERLKQAIETIQERLEFFEYVFANVHNLEIKILEMVESYHLNENFTSESEEAKLSLTFIISGFVGVGKVYFNNRHNMNPQQFADVLCSAINQSNPYFVIK